MNDWGYPDPQQLAADRKAQGEVRVYMASCDSPNPTYRQTTHFELLAMTRPEGDGDTRQFWHITTVDAADPDAEPVETVLPVPRHPEMEQWLEVETQQTTEERKADLDARIDRVAETYQQTLEQRVAALEAWRRQVERS